MFLKIIFVRLYPEHTRHALPDSDALRLDQKLRRRKVCEKLALVPGKLDHATIVAYAVEDRRHSLRHFKGKEIKTEVSIDPLSQLHTVANLSFKKDLRTTFVKMIIDHAWMLLWLGRVVKKVNALQCFNHGINEKRFISRQSFKRDSYQRGFYC